VSNPLSQEALETASSGSKTEDRKPVSWGQSPVSLKNNMGLKPFLQCEIGRGKFDRMSLLFWERIVGYSQE